MTPCLQGRCSSQLSYTPKILVGMTQLQPEYFPVSSERFHPSPIPLDHIRELFKELNFLCFRHRSNPSCKRLSSPEQI